MKKLLYLPILTLLLFALPACEKEELAPVKEEAAVASLPGDAIKKFRCPTYSYQNKSRNILNFGNPSTALILVGFEEWLSLADRQQILSQYNAYLSATREFYMLTGTITYVDLKPGTTCETVMAMMSSLENHNLVRFTAPVFMGSDLSWYGLTNEVMVSIKGPTPLATMQQLCQETNTSIVQEVFPGSYLVNVDKNAIGNAFEISTLFNRSPKVLDALPDLIFQLPPMLKKDNTVAGNYETRRQELNTW